MFKKIVKSLLVFIAGLTLLAPSVFAQEPSLPAVDELIQEIQALRSEISLIQDNAERAREIAVDSRLDSQKFMEETLYRLALWRERLGEGMMMSIAAQDAAERAERLARTAGEQAKLALSRVEEADKKIDVLSGKLAQESGARADLQRNVIALSRDVDALKRDVSLAKEMAATAKAQAEA
ncbi:hypothetical protein IBX65_09365, partial [Candidatus Aerophobetes bacterium]|nr:hypothetical protein [Candidatus Aerophobetes bacterium]